MKLTELHKHCLICGGESLDALSGYEEHHLCQCGSCGFVFSRAIPEKSLLQEFYAEDYDRTSYLSPITVKRYEDLLDSFEPLRKTNKLLDVGCGYGFFLEIAKKKGWEVYGTELSTEVAAQLRAKGISMFVGEFQDYQCDPETFDVIVSIEVIEHINNPIAHVEKAHCLLRKGGKFYLSTPNFNSYLRKRLGAQYDVIDYPNHLCYYTPKTLTKLFTEHGFNKERLETTGISITRLKTSKGKSNQQYVSETSDDEMLRYRIEKNALLKFGKWISNGVLNLLKIGDSMKATFVKE